MIPDNALFTLEFSFVSTGVPAVAVTAWPGSPAERVFYANTTAAARLMYCSGGMAQDGRANMADAHA